MRHECVRAVAGARSEITKPLRTYDTASPDRPAFRGYVAVVRHPAPINQHDVSRQFQRFAQLVRGHQYRLTVGDRIAKNGLQDRNGSIVKRSERLVQQQNLRIMDKCASDRKALTHSAAELTYQSVSNTVEPTFSSQLIAASSIFCKSYSRPKSRRFSIAESSS